MNNDSRYARFGEHVTVQYPETCKWTLDPGSKHFFPAKVYLHGLMTRVPQVALTLAAELKDAAVYADKLNNMWLADGYTYDPIEALTVWKK